MDTDPSDMLIFAVVVREGGFSAAARRLHLTRQSVSESVARLERSLGVRLLERTTRVVRVTEAGLGYAAQCAAIAAQIEEANDAVRARQGEPMGRLRVSAPTLFGRRFLTEIVARFALRYPQVEVELLLADRRVDLVEEGFDVAIRAGELEDSALAVRSIGSAQIVVLASPALLQGHPPPTVDTLHDYPMIATRPVERWFIGERAVAVQPRLRVNDLEMAHDLAVAGVGLVQLPRFVAADALRDGRLVALFPDEPPTIRHVWVVWPSRHHVPARVRLFIDALVAEGAVLTSAST